MQNPLRVYLRSQNIFFTFSSRGLGGVLTGLGIEVGRRGMAVVGKTRKPQSFATISGRELARTLVQLGPTFIKLGQVLATRPDLVGDEVALELKMLLDAVPPIPFSAVQKLLKKELGDTTLKAAFAYIDPKPLASGSIGQTHRATLSDGTDVILKVQRPKAAEIVKVDLVLLEGLIRSIHPFYPKANLLDLFREFKWGTLREIDYREEAKNIVRFRKNYRKLFSSPDIVFPRYYKELSTAKVLTLEPMHGEKVTSLRKGSTVAVQAAAQTLAAVLEQIFDHGFFHADPHAGNLFFMADEGRVGFIDLGLVGQLEPEDKRKFLRVLLALIQRDKDRLAKSLFELGTPNAKTEYDKFAAEIEAFIEKLKTQGLDNVKIDEVLRELLAIAKNHSIAIPLRYVLMIRSCLVVEGLARELDPNISVFKIAAPVITKSLLKSYTPWSVLRRMRP